MKKGVQDGATRSLARRNDALSLIYVIFAKERKKLRFTKEMRNFSREETHSVSRVTYGGQGARKLGANSLAVLVSALPIWVMPGDKLERS